MRRSLVDLSSLLTPVSFIVVRKRANYLSLAAVIFKGVLSQSPFAIWRFRSLAMARLGKIGILAGLLVQWNGSILVRLDLWPHTHHTDLRLEFVQKTLRLV